MAVTAAMVKELRELTGVGMSDCKNALVESEGDQERAIEILREKGVATAAKKAGRIASEGLVHVAISDDGKTGVVVEVNSETDYVAKNAEFKAFVEQVAQQAAVSDSRSIDEFHAEQWFDGTSGTVKDVLTQKVAQTGENVNVRRFEKFVMEESGVLVSYIHGGGKVAVLVQLNSEVQDERLVEAGKNICMQIAAMNPRFVDRSSVPAEFIEKEREILTQQTINEGKPAAVAEKIVQGRLNKELQDFCLLDQEYVKSSDLTVAKYLEEVGKEIGSKITVKRFLRYETGEGLEKKQENFADEVNKVING
jgi:elongation factor Ts